MKRLFLLSFALALALTFLAACRASPTPAVTPTEAPAVIPPTMAPSPTPAPTATAALPTPTLTPISAFTPTPLVTATPDPNRGVGEVVYEDKLDGSSSWFWGHASDIVKFSISDGQLNAVITQASQAWQYSISPDTVKIGDQQVRVTMRANLCYDNDEYGLIFRGNVDSRNNYNLYVFKLRCGGAARLELLENESPTVLVDWAASPAIVRGAPAENTLMAWMAKDQFHFYVNDKYLFSAQDASYPSGFYGFFVRDRTNGGLSVSFLNLVARAVTLP